MKKKNKKSRNQQQLSAQQPKGKRAIIDKKAPIFTGHWAIHLLLFLFFVIATILVYTKSLHLGFFAVDDPGYVINNPWIKGMTGRNIQYILAHPYFTNYSPMHLFSYMVDYSFAGTDAFTFHLSSTIWAGIVAGFVYLVALAFTNNRIIAISAAILFIVHPAHVEAVAWISSRKDLVAAAFALPSLLAYMYYRRGGNRAWRWYILSLILFLFAVSGKLSVATFPAVFLAMDYFLEKRRLVRSLADKIPFLVIGMVIGLVVTSEQPSFGNHLDGFVLMKVTLQNTWLLSGFGTYVLYRLPPASGGMLLQVAGVLILLLFFAAPLLLRRRLPFVAVMIYWILFAFIPSQVLSFTHPVTDRYLFFPSVAAVMLIAWVFITVAKKTGRSAVIVSCILLTAIASIWTMKTLNYLDEWKDPRSVWYAAMKKSKDPVVAQNLGTYYTDLSRKFNPGYNDSIFPKKEREKLARLMWQQDPRLPGLLSEWNANQHNGPTEKEFQDYIRNEALQAFEKAIREKGNRVMPAIYYNRGNIFLDRGNLAEARKEYELTLAEVQNETFAEVKEQLTIYCYYAIGVIEIRQGNTAGGKTWFEKADATQTSYGRIWLPRIRDDIRSLERSSGN